MARACLQPAFACLFADHARLLQQALKDVALKHVIVSRATATPAAARSKKQAFLDITNVAERETKRAKPGGEARGRRASARGRRDQGEGVARAALRQGRSGAREAAYARA